MRDHTPGGGQHTACQTTSALPRPFSPGPAPPYRPLPPPSFSASFKSYRNWPLSDSDCGQIAVRFGTRCFFAASAHKGPAVVCGQGSIFRTPGESSRSPSTNRDNLFGMLEASHTVTCVILGAESSRSPEVHGLWPPGPWCGARAAFSKLRGVLAEALHLWEQTNLYA